jgi:prepilin-type processing-associated H-X9-DG protein
MARLGGFLRRRLRRRRDEGIATSVGGLRPGRAHLVFADGSVVAAELDPEARERAEYLARRVVAPPPPPAS